MSLRRGGEKFQQENSQRDYLLETVQEISLYELYILDTYIKNGELESIEQYFYMEDFENSILDEYRAFTTDKNINKKSMGGYYLTYINPKVEGIYIPNNYQFSIMLSKEIDLLNEEEELIKVIMKTGYVKIECYIDPYQEKIECNKLGKIEELSVIGEEKDEKKNEGEKGK